MACWSLASLNSAMNAFAWRRAAMQSATARRLLHWRQRRAAGFGSSRARRRDFCGRNPRARSDRIGTNSILFLTRLLYANRYRLRWKTLWSGLALLNPKAAAVHVRLQSDGVARFNHLSGFFGGEHIESAGPALTFHRQALRHRCALRQHTVEPGIMPVRRKIHRAVVEGVAIDETGDRRKWQVGAIDRVGEQDRVARRRFDGPEIVEFDDEAVLVEERRAGNLAGIVKPDRRMWVLADESLGDFE